MTTPSPRSAPGFTLARALVLAAGAAGLALGGCDDRDATSQAIQDASIRLAGLAPGSSPVLPTSALDREYQAIIAALQPITTGDAAAGKKSAANLLISRAVYGQTLAPLDAAAQLQLDTIARATAARAALKAYVTQAAHAAGVAAYDPAEELQAIDAEVAAIKASLAEAARQKEALDAQIASLRAQAAERAREAGKQRDADAALRQQMASATQVQGLALIEEATRHRRAADALDAEAADLEAQAAQVAPAAALAALRIESLTTQQGRLAEARKAVEGRAAIATERAAKAREAADSAREALGATLGAVADLSARFGERVREAVDGFQKAASAAQKARQANSPAAGAAFAEARQAEGDTHWLNAQTLDVYAGLLEAAATAQPPLPDAPALAERAAEARAQQQAALDAATTAYQEARDAGGGGAGGVGELDARLIRLIKATSGGKIDLSAELQQDAETPPPADEPAPEVASGDGPESAIRAMIDLGKAKDFQGLMALYHAPDPAQQQVLASLLDVAEKMSRLDEACKAKFGVSLTEAMQQMAGAAGAAAGGIDLAALENATADDFQVTVTGDTATAVGPGGGQPLGMRQVDGRWLFELPPAAMTMGPMFGALAKAVDPLIARVEGGEFQNVQQVVQALGMAMMGGGLVPPPPGGG